MKKIAEKIGRVAKLHKYKLGAKAAVYEKIIEKLRGIGVDISKVDFPEEEKVAENNAS